MAYFPYVTFVSVVSFNDVTIPAFFFVDLRRVCCLASRFVFFSDENLRTRIQRRKPCTISKFSTNAFTPVTREIADSTPVELQGIIKKFVLAVRKKNGKEYERSSLAKSLKYPKHRPASSQNQLWILLNDKEFCEVILKKKQKPLLNGKCPGLLQTIRTEKSSKIRCENKLKITVSDDSSQGQ